LESNASYTGNKLLFRQNVFGFEIAAKLKNAQDSKMFSILVKMAALRPIWPGGIQQSIKNATSIPASRPDPTLKEMAG